jgi:hypothetical protein
VLNPALVRTSCSGPSLTHTTSVLVLSGGGSSGIGGRASSRRSPACEAQPRRPVPGMVVTAVSSTALRKSPDS